MTWGVAIPGVSMAAFEMPSIAGLHVLENPEVGDGPRWGHKYKLSEVAEHHCQAIEALKDLSSPLHLIGMSMGGMIAALLATEFHHRLPPDCRFWLFVTSANTPELPTVPNGSVDEWKKAGLADREVFERLTRRFFSETFRKTYPAKYKAFVESRLRMENKQSAAEFFRQLSAVQSFDGHNVFPKMDPTRTTIVTGLEDEALGPPHTKAIRKLLRKATYVDVPGLGHMVNLERPELFDVRNGLKV